MFLQKLDRRITIEKETTAKNAVGTPVETYTTLKTTYASVSHKSASTEFDEDYAIASTITTFAIRYDNRFNYKCRILYNSEYYKVLGIEHIGRKEGFVIRTIRFEDE